MLGIVPIKNIQSKRRGTPDQLSVYQSRGRKRNFTFLGALLIEIR